MGDLGPIQTFEWIGGLGSSVSLCLGSTCRRRRKTSPAKGEPKREARGPQLRVVTLMQRTRLDEQELAWKEWRRREEDKRRNRKWDRRKRRRRLRRRGEGGAVDGQKVGGGFFV